MQACGRARRNTSISSFAGPKGEAHGGATRPACSRVSAQHPRGTTIRNVRQLSVLADEDLAEIAEAMGLAQLDPAWLGASLVLRGIPDFIHLPPSSRLQGPDGVTIVVDMENRPACSRQRSSRARFRARARASSLRPQGRRGCHRLGRARRRAAPGRRDAPACARPAGLGASCRSPGERSGGIGRERPLAARSDPQGDRAFRSETDAGDIWPGRVVIRRCRAPARPL